MFQNLGDGVFRRRYESLDSNIGVVLGEDGILIIDTRASHVEGDQIRAELATLSALPVRWVVNTHWHWDHVFGNSCFPDAEIWGHVRCREVLLSRQNEMKADALEWLPKDQHAEIGETVIVAPSATFSDRVSLDIGRQVDLSFHGRAHTDADIRIIVPDAGVAFLGDLIEEGGPPSFGDSYPTIWPTTLQYAMQKSPEVLVPGHGDVVDRAFAEGQRAELAAVADLADACLRGELSVGEGSVRGPFSEEVMRSALDRAMEVGQAWS
jgi:glyoxylase-like metal-dependent hydrolase (beta-lactamase superfamily II)